MCHSKYNEVDIHIKKDFQENVHISGDNRPVTSNDNCMLCLPHTASIVQVLKFLILFCLSEKTSLTMLTLLEVDNRLSLNYWNTLNSCRLEMDIGEAYNFEKAYIASDVHDRDRQYAMYNGALLAVRSGNVALHYEHASETDILYTPFTTRWR